MSTTLAVGKPDYVQILRRTIESAHRINERIRTCPHPAALEMWVAMRDAQLAFMQRRLEDVAHIESKEFDELREAARPLLVGIQLELPFVKQS